MVRVVVEILRRLFITPCYIKNIARAVGPPLRSCPRRLFITPP